MNIRKLVNSILFYILILIVCVLVAMPFIIMLSYSFRTSHDIFSLNISLFPEKPTMEAYRNALIEYKFSGHGFLRWSWNSILICGTATFFSIFFAAMTGYAISRFRFTGKKILWFLIALTQTIPWIIILVPYYMTLSSMGFVNNRLILSMTYMAVFMPTSAWLFVGFFNKVPIEIEEAAKIDGCSPWGVFLRIIIPISIASISAIALVAFVTGWGDFLFASVFMKKSALWTLPLGLTSFKGEHYIQWSEIMAMSAIVTVPIICLFIYLQRYLVDLMAGGVKQ